MAKQLPGLKGDLRTTQGLILEHEEVHGQEILYEVQELRNTELLDTLHAEVLDSGRRFKPAVEILVSGFTLNPTQQLLGKWGIDEQRDIVIYPAVILLVNRGLAKFSDPEDITTRPIFDVGIGDRFTWDDTRYECLEVVRERYWGNTNRPLYLRITANRWRESVEDLDCDDIGSAGPFAGGRGTILPDQ